MRRFRRGGFRRSRFARGRSGRRRRMVRRRNRGARVSLRSVMRRPVRIGFRM